MNHSRVVYWHEGLFLRPQHFQQQDCFHQDNVHQLLNIVAPHFWGVKSLSIVQPALDNMLFELNHFDLVFQDGTHVTFPGNSVVRRRTLDGLWDESGKPMSVFIGVRKLTPGRQNVSSLEEKEGEQKQGSNMTATRFCVPSFPSSTFDLYSDNNKGELYFLDINLQIFIDNEAAKAVDFHLIKIAELHRFGNEVRLSEHFIPPSLTLQGSPILSGLVREIKEQLTARARELALYKQDKAIENMELGSRDMIYLLALLTLNRYVPLFHHFLESGDSSPWSVYAVMRQLVGELSTFSSNYNVFGGLGSEEDKGLPMYFHDDLGNCYHNAAYMIIKLMDELTAGPDYVAPLVFDGTYFFTDLNDRIFQGNNRFYLCINTNLPFDKVVNVIQSIAKVSSREHLPILIARALPGVTIEHDSSPPTELPRSSKRIYFILDNHSTAWDAIRDGLNMAVYFDTSPGDLSIELMVIYGK